jgi:hypothetical protein
MERRIIWVMCRVVVVEQEFLYVGELTLIGSDSWRRMAQVSFSLDSGWLLSRSPLEILALDNSWQLF